MSSSKLVVVLVMRPSIAGRETSLSDRLRRFVEYLSIRVHCAGTSWPLWRLGQRPQRERPCCARIDATGPGGVIGAQRRLRRSTGHTGTNGGTSLNVSAFADRDEGDDDDRHADDSERHYAHPWPTRVLGDDLLMSLRLRQVRLQLVDVVVEPAARASTADSSVRWIESGNTCWLKLPSFTTTRLAVSMPSRHSTISMSFVSGPPWEVGTPHLDGGTHHSSS